MAVRGFGLNKSSARGRYLQWFQLAVIYIYIYMWLYGGQGHAKKAYFKVIQDVILQSHSTYSGSTENWSTLERLPDFLET